MKNVLVTGKDSYIGMSVESWLMKENDKYKVDTVDMIDGSWKEKDFSPYDVVFHVAGIAHVKETKENRDLYYKVNRDLAFETAKKAKEEGVKQFIFLSSMSVYGIDNGVIDEETPINPKNNYGKSKMQGEELIKPLDDDNFKVAILRPPMIYGKRCKGNYQRLASFAKKSPVFPKIQNQRSMLHIDNLCEFIKLIIDNEESGLFFPQNKEYVCTSEMVKIIAEVNGKKMRMTKAFNPIIKVMSNVNLINKVFGNLVYEMGMSEYDKCEYRVKKFKGTIKATEQESI